MSVDVDSLAWLRSGFECQRKVSGDRRMLWSGRYVPQPGTWGRCPRCNFQGSYDVIASDIILALAAAHPVPI